MQVDPQITALLHVVYMFIVKHEFRHIDRFLSRKGYSTAFVAIDLNARARVSRYRRICTNIIADICDPIRAIASEYPVNKKNVLPVLNVIGFD